MARKLPFPRYFNRPSIWLIWDKDILLFDMIVAAVTVFLLFVLSVPPYLIVIILLVAVRVGHVSYTRLVKDASPGYLGHLFYSLGIKDPNRKSKYKQRTGRNLMPWGFEKEFRD